jgi:hypothetical protein
LKQTAHLRLKAQVNHAVSLIQHHVVALVQHAVVPLNAVQQATWCCDHDLAAAPQLAALLLNRLATNH